jgi:aspartyl-tRNA(Asn)/glutamyl-tRNA(Gln) amidotransferase subunit A
MTPEIVKLDATALAERVKARTVSPIAAIEAYLERITARNPTLNAVVTVTAEQAMDQARDLERRLAEGQNVGPLAGVPVVLKDIIYTKGIRTTMGSRLFSEFVPSHDAAVVERLQMADAIIVGKAHTHEFAYGPTSANAFLGPCRNPWDIDRIPGGSSGGSAASVAAGLSLVGLGTDTGGSVRVPAALCGVVGFKPTYGRISRFGVFPCSWALDHVGIVTKSVRDAGLVLSTLAGRDPRDLTTSRSSGYAQSWADPSQLRVGVLLEHLSEPMDEDVRSAFQAAMAETSGVVARVLDVSIPTNAYARSVSTAITALDSLLVHEQLLRDRGAEYGQDVHGRFPLAVGLTARDYVRAQQARTRIIVETSDVFTRVDVIASPTVPIPAPLIGADEIVLNGQTRPVPAVLSVLSRLGNLTGAPTITVPYGRSSIGLPIGLQLMARPGQESALLALAEKVGASWTQLPN